VKRSGEGKICGTCPSRWANYNRDESRLLRAADDVHDWISTSAELDRHDTQPFATFGVWGTIRARNNRSKIARQCWLNSDADHVTECRWPTFPEAAGRPRPSLGRFTKMKSMSASAFRRGAGGWANWRQSINTSANSTRGHPSARAYLESRCNAPAGEIEERKRQAAAEILRRTRCYEVGRPDQEKSDLLKQIRKRAAATESAGIYLTRSPAKKESCSPKHFDQPGRSRLFARLIEQSSRDGDKERRC